LQKLFLKAAENHLFLTTYLMPHDANIET